MDVASRRRRRLSDRMKPDAEATESPSQVRFDQPSGKPGKPSERQSGPKRPSRLKWIVAAVAGTVVLLVLLAPVIVAKTGLLPMLLSRAIGSEQATVTLQGASLSWFSTIDLHGLAVQDVDGEPLLTTASVSSTKTLLGLLAAGNDLGSFRIDRPHLYLTLSTDDSNWERWLATFPSSDEEPSEPVAARIEIHDGRMTIFDPVAARNWELADLAAQMVLPGTSAEATTAQLACAVTGDADVRKFAAVVTLPAADDPPSPVEVQLKTDRLPLAMLQPLVNRFGGKLEVQGALTSELALQLSDIGIRTRGFATVEALDLSGEMLDNEHLALKRLHLPCQIAFDGTALQIDHMRVECSLADLRAQGRVALPRAEDDPLRWLADQEVALAGWIDLAALAGQLPRTLSIRPGTEMTSGEVQVTYARQSDQGSRQWRGQIKASNLAAVQSGQTVRWQKPVDVSFAVCADAHGLLVDQLKCESDFLHLSAAGTPRQIEGKASYDLQTLTDQLAQFVDLDGWQLSGRGEGEFRWQLDEQGQFTGEIHLPVHDLLVTLHQGGSISEKHALLEASASGSLADNRLQSLGQAELHVTADGDRCDAQLTGPIERFPSAGSGWPISLQVEGEAARLLARAARWYPVPEMQIDGATRLTADVLFRDGRFDFQQASLNLKPCRISGYGVNLDEPVLAVTAQGRWDSGTQQLELSQAEAQTGSSTLTARQLRLSLAGSQLHVAGKLSVDSDVESIRRWIASTKHKGSSPDKQGAWGGRLSGTVDISGNADQLKADVAATGTDLRLVRWEKDARGRDVRTVLWHEPQAQFNAAAVYQQSPDRLDIRQASLDSKTATARLSGAVAGLTTTAEADLTGTLEYDLAKLSKLAQPHLGSGVMLHGRDTANFKLAGPLRPAAASPTGRWSGELAASADFGWQRGEVHGFELGASRVAANLDNGILDVGPLDIPISKGRLTAAPTVRLDREPMELHLPRGRVLHSVHITPQMCNEWLRYVAPIVADATRTEGSLSLDVEKARIPLSQPAQGDLTGRLAVHSIDVLPGPLAMQFILLARQIEALAERRIPPATLRDGPRALLKIEQQTVDFQLAEGRVHHRGVAVKAGNAVIWTTGSVGVDQSLDLTVHVPIQDRWIHDGPFAETLKGRAVQIGIRGTFDRPRVDTDALQNFARQTARQTARNALFNELDKQLNRLLPPPDANRQ